MTHVGNYAAAAGFHRHNQEALHLLQGHDYLLLSRILEKDRAQRFGKTIARRIICD